jgi:hypothetical protein
VWRLRTERGIGIDSIRAMQADLSDRGLFVSRAADFYCSMLDVARAANSQRADAFDAERGCARLASVSFWWWPVLLLGLFEIAAALLSVVVS